MDSLKQILAVALCAEHGAGAVEERAIVAEEALCNDLPVGGAIPVNAQWTPVDRNHTHAVAYGAVRSFNVKHAAVRVETV